MLRAVNAVFRDDIIEVKSDIQRLDARGATTHGKARKRKARARQAVAQGALGDGVDADQEDEDENMDESDDDNLDASLVRLVGAPALNRFKVATHPSR